MPTLDIYYMLELGLIFILIMTGAWKKSLTTTLFVVSLTVMFYNNTINTCLIQNNSYLVATILSVVAVFRAMFHNDNDRLIRG